MVGTDRTRPIPISLLTPPPPRFQATYFNGKVIEVALPKQMILEVVETDPGEKGNTAQGATKVTGDNSRAHARSHGSRVVVDSITGTAVATKAAQKRSADSTLSGATRFDRERLGP